jgi:hypothetical protein
MPHYKIAVQMECAFTTEMEIEIEADSKIAARDLAAEKIMDDPGWGFDGALTWQRSGSMEYAEPEIAIREAGFLKELPLPKRRLERKETRRLPAKGKTTCSK